MNLQQYENKNNVSVKLLLSKCILQFTKRTTINFREYNPVS